MESVVDKYTAFDLYDAVKGLMRLSDADFETEFNNLVQLLSQNRGKALSLLDKSLASLTDPKGLPQEIKMLHIPANANPEKRAEIERKVNRDVEIMQRIRKALMVSM